MKERNIAEPDPAHGARVFVEDAEVEVLVVGYGPVGAALACLLGRYGVRTMVVDKAREILPIPRAISLDSDALRILQFVGLDAGAFDTVPIPYVRLISPLFGEFVRMDTSGTSDGHPRLVTFHQPDLERALRAVASRYPSVTVRCPSQLTELHDGPEGVRAVLRDEDGRTRIVRAQYAIGADGAASLVRSAIGVGFPGQTFQEWLVIDARDAPRPMDHVAFLCDHRRPIPHMVAPGGRQRWEFLLHPHEARDEMQSDAKIRELLAPWAGSDGVTVERKAIYRFHARTSDTFRKGRVFLAGDAAHVTPPFAGQGLAAGLRDAANLSWKLAWVVQGMAGEGVLDSYDRERRPHARQTTEQSCAMGSLVAPSRPFAAYCMQALFRVLAAFPRTRRWLARSSAKKPLTQYAEGLFVAGQSGAARMRGTWLPQGWLRGQDGALQLSDTILGPGLTCIGFGGALEASVAARVGEAWRARGGSMVQVTAPEGPWQDLGSRGFKDVDGTFADYLSSAWMVIVRPDGVLLHDGPLRDASRVLEEALALLDLPSADSAVAPRVETLSP